MKREAIYHADTNELEELPQMEKPDINEFKDPLFCPTGECKAFLDEVQAYNAHLASLRRLPCSPQPGFKDGEKYVENEDYEVKGAGDWKWCAQLKGNYFAVPIVPVESWGKLTLAELEEPIGNFILNQKDIKSVMAPDGAYYHYKDVCVMLARYRHYKPQKQ